MYKLVVLTVLILILGASNALAQCLNVTAPSNGSFVTPGSSIIVRFNDTCASRWFECVFVDGISIKECGTPNPQQFTFNSTGYVGTHSVGIKSFNFDGTEVLGFSQITVHISGLPTPKPTPSPTPQFNTPVPTAFPTNIATSQPTPVPSASATPVPTASPTPTPQPTPACIIMTSPSNGSTVNGTLTIQYTLNVQSCPTYWFTSAWYGSLNSPTKLADFPPSSAVGTGLSAQQLSINTTLIPNGATNLIITAQTINPNSTTIATASVMSTVNNAAPTPTPTSTATAVAHFSNLLPNAPLPSDATCAAEVNASPIPEAAPWNVDDGSPAHWDSNHTIVNTPSYFYTFVNNQIGYVAADFARVDGAYAGSTDMILRWAACKNGVDEDWVRAESQTESAWHQDCAAMHGGNTCKETGDKNASDGHCTGLPANISGNGFTITDGAGNYVATTAIPLFGGCLTASPCSGSSPCLGCNGLASWSIIQNKVACAEWPTFPMSTQSTAWASDYRWAKFHSCMIGDAANQFSHSPDYTSAVAKALSNPNSLASGSGFSGPTNLLTNETNLQYLGLGCVGTHFCGGWYGDGGNGGCITYLTTANGSNSFIPLLSSHAWPGGHF